jgi:hypothetical protein
MIEHHLNFDRSGMLPRPHAGSSTDEPSVNLASLTFAFDHSVVSAAATRYVRIQVGSGALQAYGKATQEPPCLATPEKRAAGSGTLCELACIYQRYPVERSMDPRARHVEETIS